MYIQNATVVTTVSNSNSSNIVMVNTNVTAPPITSHHTVSLKVTSPNTQLHGTTLELKNYYILEMPINIIVMNLLAG